MRVPSWLKTYLHSLLGIAVAMIIIFWTLNFLHTRGPGSVQPLAGTLGSFVGGSRYNFTSN